MHDRLTIAETAPDAYRAMLGLERYLASCPLPRSLQELVKLRASQLNGCGYCVDMHSHDLADHGESAERLYAVAVWWEAPFFTDAERAALALTEQAVRSDRDGVTDAVWDEVLRHFTAEEAAALVTVIATIRAWNTFGVTLRLTPGSHRR